jgi:hypothetical protein
MKLREPCINSVLSSIIHLTPLKGFEVRLLLLVVVVERMT